MKGLHMSLHPLSVSGFDDFLHGVFFLQQDIAFLQFSLADPFPKLSIGWVLSKITNEASMAATIFIRYKDRYPGSYFPCRSS